MSQIVHIPIVLSKSLATINPNAECHPYVPGMPNRHVAFAMFITLKCSRSNTQTTHYPSDV